jgi:hypothetical protein
MTFIWLLSILSTCNISMSASAWATFLYSQHLAQLTPHFSHFINDSLFVVYLMMLSVARTMKHRTVWWLMITSQPNLRHYTHICLERMKKTRDNLRISHLWAKIWNWHLSKHKQKHLENQWWGTHILVHSLQLEFIALRTVSQDYLFHGNKRSLY